MRLITSIRKPAARAIATASSQPGPAVSRGPLVAKTTREAQDRVLAAKIFFAVRVEKDGTMQTRNRGDYTIAGHELVAEGADLRVQVLTLAAGQCVPWHYHTEISDSFVCLEGPMVVETRAPR